MGSKSELVECLLSCMNELFRVTVHIERTWVIISIKDKISNNIDDVSSIRRTECAGNLNTQRRDRRISRQTIR